MRANGWGAVETRHLEALRAVGEEGSFVAAADRLGYTQSAVSQQIAALERGVGLRLLERPGGRRPVSLTQAGELLLRHARAISDRMVAARKDLEALAEGTAGTLRVGIFQSVGCKVLPALLRRFSRICREVDLRLTEASNGEGLLDLVEAGELDLTFALLPAGDGPFESVELLRDPYVLAVPSDWSRAAGPPAAGVDELDGLDLICFRSCPSERRLEEHLRTCGIEPSVVFRSDDNATVQALVGAGDGVGLMSELSVERTDSRIAVLSLPDLPPRVVGLAWHGDRHRPAAAAAFVDVAREVCAELGGKADPATPVRLT
jgi:DNA-binding transcriptional LysR family regulator